MAKKKKWYSLAEMLELYSPAVVSTAIEQRGIFVVDRFGRRVKAVEGSLDDIYSQHMRWNSYRLDMASFRIRVLNILGNRSDGTLRRTPLIGSAGQRANCRASAMVRLFSGRSQFHGPNVRLRILSRSLRP
jgi:hypothetical protein